MYCGPKVTMLEILDSRELRASRQREWISTHSLPLISFTINMVGEVKLNHISKVAFQTGRESIITYCQSNCVEIKKQQVFEANTGFELLLCAENTTSAQLKALMVNLEGEHPLGRLFDIDVLDEKGMAVSRDELGLARRKCYVCDEQAKICARNRSHSLDELIGKMSEMINDFE